MFQQWGAVEKWSHPDHLYRETFGHGCCTNWPWSSSLAPRRRWQNGSVVAPSWPLAGSATQRQHVSRKKWGLWMILRSRRSRAPSCLEWTLVEGCESSYAPLASCRHSAALWAWRRPASPTEAWWVRAAAQLPPEETTARWWGRSRVEQIYCQESMPSLRCTEKQQLSLRLLVLAIFRFCANSGGDGNTATGTIVRNSEKQQNTGTLTLYLRPSCGSFSCWRSAGTEEPVCRSENWPVWTGPESDHWSGTWTLKLRTFEELLPSQ